MNEKNAVDLMARWGDTLERRIAQEYAELAPVLNPYASVWAAHIAPRRDRHNPTCLSDPDWVSFCASHYTAIVRVFQAWEKLRTLRSCCERAGLLPKN